MVGRMRPHLAFLFFVVAASSTACVERSRDLAPSDRERVAALVGRVAPAPQHALDVDFGSGAVELVGYDVDARSWSPGQTLTVTWYWHVLRPLDAGYGLFTHVTDAAGNVVLNADTAGDLRALFPPDRWEPGTYLRDTQRIALPTDFRSASASLRIGFWRGDDRLPVTRGAEDGENRAVALTLPTLPGPRRAPPPVPSLHVLRTSRAPTLDGRLDEEDWVRAPRTGAFLETLVGGSAPFFAEARALWDDDRLYVAFEVRDDDLRADYRTHDDHLWEQDCVELMLDPDGDGRNYFELQVSPRGVTFDTRYDRRRVPQPFGHLEWDSGMEASVAVDGSLDDGDGDRGYTVELAIPWTAFATGEPPAARPEAGSEWRANLYVMDRRERGQRAAAWSPPRVGDFHVPARFGRLLFTVPEGSAPPSE